MPAQVKWDAHAHTFSCLCAPVLGRLKPLSSESQTNSQVLMSPHFMNFPYPLLFCTLLVGPIQTTRSPTASDVPTHN
ncbi:unnamed protein product [Protopolystoma xenopodis]|uniref:Uncharacterized protein n=1 Tax=Protopolystoma xenopodis TaxID=117903 RepID=A0A3S5FGN4_9PLAT|nr:unnamed protein product [Protopolystoma xenopodis]